MFESEIARGVKLLDQKMPGWRGRINRAELVMRDPCQCVVGQVLDVDDSDDYTLAIEGGLGIEDLEAIEGSWRLYPNPNSGSFDLSFELPGYQALELEIFTIQGKRVHHQKLHGIAGENIFRVNVPDLSEGVYFVKVKTDDGVIERKFSVY